MASYFIGMFFHIAVIIEIIARQNQWPFRRDNLIFLLDAIAGQTLRGGNHPLRKNRSTIAGRQTSRKIGCHAEADLMLLHRESLPLQQAILTSVPLRALGFAGDSQLIRASS